MSFNLNKPSHKYPFITYTTFLFNTNLLDMKTSLNLFLLNNDLETKFFLIFGTYKTLLRVSYLLKIIFFPYPSTFDVDKFLINNYSPSVIL